MTGNRSMVSRTSDSLCLGNLPFQRAPSPSLESHIHWGQAYWCPRWGARQVAWLAWSLHRVPWEAYPRGLRSSQQLSDQRRHIRVVRSDQHPWLREPSASSWWTDHLRKVWVHLLQGHTLDWATLFASGNQPISPLHEASSCRRPFRSPRHWDWTWHLATWLRHWILERVIHLARGWKAWALSR